MNDILKKINQINKRQPATIKQWLKSRAEYVALKNSLPSTEGCPRFILGHLMPVVGSCAHLIPSGMSHLFSVFPDRFEGKIDYNSIKVKTRLGWRTATRGKHEVHVTSIAVFKGNKLEWLVGPSDVVKTFVLPDGWSWFNDSYGVGVKDRAGVDFHPIFNSELTVEHLLCYHSYNKALRQNQMYDVSLRQATVQNLDSTFVTLEDSARAGNCIEGSLAFAERVLGLKREDVLGASYFLKVLARKVWDSRDYRAQNACVQAYMRETNVSN